jgi:hypothetical protein
MTVRRSNRYTICTSRAVDEIRVSFVAAALGALAFLGFSLVSASTSVAVSSSSRAPATSQQTAPSKCGLRPKNQRWEGSCGPLFEQNPVLTIAPAKFITTGIWREDVHPTAVWAGEMTDSGSPNAPIEIEIYAGESGLLRSEYGWFPVSSFVLVGSTLRFTVDASHEVPPNELDRKIAQRAAAILSSDSMWNRADDRKCPATATTWSIYCAMERATIEITGAFHHRRPALEVVRKIVEDRSVGRQYQHRLMEYNNDPSTHLDDVQSLFAEALRQRGQG